MTGQRRILIVTYPGQGLVNPSLRFANHLLKMGVLVTFSSSFSIIRRIDKQNTSQGLTFAPFFDGHDNGIQPTTNLKEFLTDFETNGSCAIAEIISSAAATGKPFDHLIYTTIVPWGARVANAHNLKSTLLWCQPATVLGIYYYYFNGYEDLISSNKNNPTFSINLPRLPPLTIADLPSFFSPSSPTEHDCILSLYKNHIDALKTSSRILINTFDELEIESIKAIDKFNFLPIGPLIPSELLEEKVTLSRKEEEAYIQWLNTKPKSSVVYVSFGSWYNLTIDQGEEMSAGLLESGRPFLWVIRDGAEAAKLSKIDELKKQGMIVDWCSQVEVLTHKAVGCFVTHCGWNSTVETLVAGIPVVAFPQWTDQGTNAKLIVDVWKIGVQVRIREGDGVAEGKEITRCVEMVMGDGEMRENVVKWSELARKALSNGGLSTVNLQAFLDDA
ncbi:UDP-Glycosyltransferase superfamily protein [Artemisia annua]|uniref:Glycosyltransferase n=1 Tax=Artemisia annua TaxID=35608 RepID=A0A2U1NAB8_ARTAN|nr:UDP-Glycosyltransferase superfamily protein [Artemisia annua]